jgi:hypothetical protein
MARAKVKETTCNPGGVHTRDIAMRCDSLQGSGWENGYCENFNARVPR